MQNSVDMWIYTKKRAVAPYSFFAASCRANRCSNSPYCAYFAYCASFSYLKVIYRLLLTLKSWFDFFLPKFGDEDWISIFLNHNCDNYSVSMMEAHKFESQRDSAWWCTSNPFSWCMKKCDLEHEPSCNWCPVSKGDFQKTALAASSKSSRGSWEAKCVSGKFAHASLGASIFRVYSKQQRGTV
jgi:hypothetical protein